MDLFRKLMTGGDGQQAVIAVDLDAQIARAQKEKQALEALVTSAQAHLAQIPRVNASLEETERRAAAIAQQLESLAARADELENVRRQAEAVEMRVLALEVGVMKSEERVQQALARETHVDEHRSAVEQLVSTAQGAIARLEGLKQESAAFMQLEERLPRLRKEFHPLLDQQAALKNDLDQLRTGIATLAQDAETGREAALKARAHATKATEVVTDLQRKLEPLSQIGALGQDTEAQLRTLNALAEHVAAKVKALENQQSVVEHALVESRRVHEMVWDMEVQIKKLDEGTKRAARVEEALAKLERMQAETNTQLEEASRARETFNREAARQERDAQSLLETVQRDLDQLAVNKQEIETVHERLGIVQAGIAAAETRAEAVSAREQELAQLAERIQGMVTTVQELTASAESLQRKQGSLGALEERLDGLDAMAKRTQWQFDGLAEQRKDLDSLKTEIQAVHTTYEQTATLLDKLRGDKREVEAFLDKASSFMGQASQVETKIDALTAQIAGAEASAAKTKSIGRRRRRSRGQARGARAQNADRRGPRGTSECAQRPEHRCGPPAERSARAQGGAGKPERALRGPGRASDGRATKAGRRQRCARRAGAGNRSAFGAPGGRRARPRNAPGVATRRGHAGRTGPETHGAVRGVARAVTRVGATPRDRPGSSGGAGQGWCAQGAAGRRAGAHPEAAARHVRADRGRRRSVRAPRHAVEEARPAAVTAGRRRAAQWPR